ncbi:hypothetical protein [Ralstonia sp. RL]|uniref:hypothetical protein n=1 Tax=Ralstonia sp. RL TaxID=1839756 RepID=UPI000A58DBB9|nr:hypothetical protein [Ralstonia sp. RL]
MKSIAVLALATTLAAVSPAVFSADSSQHEEHHPDVQAAQPPQNKAAKQSTAPKATAEQMGKMDAQMNAMRDMHEKMMAAKTPEERNALMAEHMKTMQDSMSMMNGMMSGKSSSSQPPSPQMMQKQMEMMQMMMQMMMDRMGSPAPAK